MQNKIYQGDNLHILPTLEKNSVDLIYIDPPFNTGHTQKSHKGKYEDTFDNFEEFLLYRIKLALPSLKENGALFVHLDYREVHYIKVAMDRLLGRDHFMNSIQWIFDYGARQKKKWPTKHNTILWYVKNPNNYIFNYNEMDRIPYAAPGLAGKEKAAKGKTPTDCWWNSEFNDMGVSDSWWMSIVHTNGTERTGYPTQKPLGILNRIIKVHSNSGDIVLDFFAGSGTTGVSAALNDRKFILIDENPQAISVIEQRLNTINCKYEIII